METKKRRSKERGIDRDNLIKMMLFIEKVNKPKKETTTDVKHT
jgi:hypothetical protein